MREISFFEPMSLNAIGDGEGSGGGAGGGSPPPPPPPPPPPANTPPVVTTSASALAYTEGQTLVIDAGVATADADSAAFTSASVKISGGFRSGEDKLSFTADKALYGDIQGKFLGGGLLSLTLAPNGTATIAQWQAALKSVTYKNISEAPTAADRTVTFAISDDKGAIGSATRTIAVTAVNDAPTTATAPESGFGDEDTVLTGQVLAGTDVDGDALEYLLVSGPQGLTLDKGGTWSWTPPADYNGASSFSYRVSDGTATSAAKTVNLSVRPTDDTPAGSYEYVYNGLYFETGGKVGGGFDEKIGSTLYLGAKGGVSLDYGIGFGLILSANLPDAEVAVTYDIKLDEVVSEAEYTLNQQSHVDTKNWVQTGASLSTDGFDPTELGIAVDLKGKLKAKLDVMFGLSGGIDIDFGEIDLGPFGTIDLGGIKEDFSKDFSTTILNVNTGGTVRLLTLDASNLSFSKSFGIGASGDAGSITANLPDAIKLATSTVIKDGDGYGNLSVGGVSANNVLAMTLDLDNLLLSTLGLPPQILGGEFSKSIGPFNAGLSYDVVDGKLVGGLKLEQKHTFTAGDVDVTMKVDFGPEAATNGQIVKDYDVTGKLGDKFMFTTPRGEGSFKVTATYVLDGVVSTTTGLYGSATFDYKMLEAIISAGIYVDFELATLDKDIVDVKLGPVFAGSIPILEGSLFTFLTEKENIELELFTRTYTITYENFYIGEDNKDDLFTMTRRQVEADGKSGNDRITGNVLDNVIFGGADNDLLLGLAGDDRIDGGTGDDVLDGGDDDDDLQGGDGADLLTGWRGSNKLDGGDGFDMAIYKNVAAGVVASLTTGQARWGTAPVATRAAAADTAAPAEFGSDTLSGIEGLEGSAFADDLEGDFRVNLLNGLAGNDKLRGLAGEDTLIGGAGADMLDGGADFDTASYRTAEGGIAASLATMSGTVGDASGDKFTSIEGLEGSNHDDKLDGGALADVLNGLAGNDQIFGAAGDDLIIGGAGADAMRGGLGYDVASYRTAQAAVVSSLLNGGSGGDGAGDTFIDIEAIEGGAFGDTLTGNTGANKVWGLGGDDKLFGGAGDDQIWGGTGADQLAGETGNDILDGGLGDDIADGGAGTDHLFGRAGKDKLQGGISGNDILDGGADADQLTGGNGYDIFLFLSAEHIGRKSGDHDEVTDFQVNIDKIDLSALYAGRGTIGVANVASAAAVGTAANTIYVYKEGGSTWVVGNSDGVPGLDFELELNGSFNLKTSDFILNQSQWGGFFASQSQPAPNYAFMHADVLV